MARIDKYDPVDGGFRAALAADLTATSKTGNFNPLGCTLDANGRVVFAGITADNLRGVVVTTKDLKAGDIIDVMTHGEIVEMAGTAAGATVTSTATGVIDDLPADATHFKVGFTVEATRLIVRVNN